MIYYVCSIILAYLLGSISPSVFVGKYLYKLDPRNYGSHNPGTANSVYVYGFSGGAVVLLIDILKGIAALFIVEHFFADNVSNPMLLLLITGLFVIIGHCYSIFLHFKGGKGFAAFCGVSIYLFPLPSLILFIIFISILFITKYLVIATIAATILSPAVQIYLHYQDNTYNTWSWIVLFAISGLVIFRHRENIIKFINGQEHSIKDTRISKSELTTEAHDKKKT